MCPLINIFLTNQKVLSTECFVDFPLMRITNQKRLMIAYKRGLKIC